MLPPLPPLLPLLPLLSSCCPSCSFERHSKLQAGCGCRQSLNDWLNPILPFLPPPPVLACQCVQLSEEDIRTELCRALLGVGQYRLCKSYLQGLRAEAAEQLVLAAAKEVYLSASSMADKAVKQVGGSQAGPHAAAVAALPLLFDEVLH